MKVFFSPAVLVLAFALASCAGTEGAVMDMPAPPDAYYPVPDPAAEAPAPSAEPRFRVDSVQVPAPSLEGNLMGNPTVQPALVFLPPDIAPGERFPVIYFFHGFGDTSSNFRGTGWALLNEMQDGTLPRFIMVSVDGACKDRGGSFWVNSPITGNWEDFVVRDLVPWVDANYPADARSGARGLLGFSMGGFAVLNLALAHADLFGSVFAVSPGAFDANGLRDAMPTWDSGFRASYGRAFSPGTGTAGQIPAMTDDEEDREIQERWTAGFGGFDRRIRDYLSRPARLQALRIDWGRGDFYSWIPRGSVHAVALMKAAGLPVEGVEHLRDHDFNLDIARREAVPFFLGLWGMEGR